MKIPHIIERWIARYSDGEAEGSQKKLMDDWAEHSPDLQQEIKEQQAVSSHLKQTFSNPAMRTQMEDTLNQTLTSLPSQTVPNPKAWSFADLIARLSSIRLMKVPSVSSRTLGSVAVVMFLGILAVINGPIAPPKSGMVSNQSQQTLERAESLSEEDQLSMYFYGDQLDSNVYNESIISRGISELPGIVSNLGDESAGRDRSVRFREDRRFSLGRAATTEQFGSIPDGEADHGLTSLGYSVKDSNHNFGMGMGAMGGGIGGKSFDVDYDGVQDKFYVEAAPTNPDGYSAAGSEIAEIQLAQGFMSNSNITDPNADTSSENLDREEPDATEGRRIIRNARMALQVQDVLATKDRIEEVIGTVRGLISNANINQDSSVPSARLTLWVPADVLEQVIEELNSLGKALNLEVFTNDITEQYFDMESRVRNLKIQEDRLLELYAREVKKLEEILQVEKEVQRVRTEIEQLEGRKRLWDRQISLSTIEVTIVQEPEKKPIVKAEPDSVFSPIRRVWRDAGAVFLYSCSIMTGMAASVLSTVIFFLPWLVVLSLIGVAGRIIWKRS